jgi:hypothetical protein
MKVKTIVSALILSAAAIGTAQAQLAPFAGVYGKQDSHVTHEQVYQELQAARAAGLTGNQDMDNQPFQAQNEAATTAQTGTNTQAPSAQNDATPGGLADVKFGDSDNEPFRG